MDIRAAVARKAGEPLSIETVRLDGPSEGEVLVEIKATGVCHTDEFTLSGRDPEGRFPTILGGDLCCRKYSVLLPKIFARPSWATAMPCSARTQPHKLLLQNP